ncbi:MAG: glycosyltransferase family 9 protein [Saprospirales bacterium]|nr:MAG: glycosyltransferase family 9 protein [Saprospirales bacterium]
MQKKKKLLVIRFSALGDVAMVSPVVHSLLQCNPHLELVVLSKTLHQPLFKKERGFTFKAAEVRGKHKGILGLYRLFLELKNEEFEAVIDLHYSLRSRILGFFFQLSAYKVHRIDKGRKEKKKLIQLGASRYKPLMHTTERYLKVFEQAGVLFSTKKLHLPKPGKASANTNKLVDQKKQKWIGIAPFAAHPSKEWKTHKVVELAEKMRARDIKILWFGAGQREKAILEKHFYQNNQDILIAGQFKLEEELILMQHLDLMLCMDSANMHMASICGTKVVSIWGPTHPFAGFGPLENEEGIVQADLDCRPCTIYGKLKSEKDGRCARESMEKITVEEVMEKVTLLLKRN